MFSHHPQVNSPRRWVGGNLLDFSTDEKLVSRGLVPNATKHGRRENDFEQSANSFLPQRGYPPFHHKWYGGLAAPNIRQPFKFRSVSPDGNPPHGGATNERRPRKSLSGASAPSATRNPSRPSTAGAARSRPLSSRASRGGGDATLPPAPTRRVSGDGGGDNGGGATAAADSDAVGVVDLPSAAVPPTPSSRPASAASRRPSRTSAGGGEGSGAVGAEAYDANAAYADDNAGMAAEAAEFAGGAAAGTYSGTTTAGGAAIASNGWPVGSICAPESTQSRPWSFKATKATFLPGGRVRPATAVPVPPSVARARAARLAPPPPTRLTLGAAGATFFDRPGYHGCCAAECEIGIMSGWAGTFERRRPVVFGRSGEEKPWVEQA